MITPPPQLLSLSRLDGVRAVCLHRGSLVRWREIGTSLTNEQANALCSAVAQAFRQYASAERPLQEAWFEFPDMAVLAVARPVEAGQAPSEFLTLILRDRTVAAAAARAATAYFRSSES